MLEAVEVLIMIVILVIYYVVRAKIRGNIAKIQRPNKIKKLMLIIKKSEDLNLSLIHI